ncbi:excinuclease ABC subunit UvrB [candidate division TA06 bacterium]|uniref:UvrABC system protein B n=1 Tax=candidate division TA06 bacterium TaxID=2250710 RepID=A0A933IB11_UNCT6|nr:excinuclease ABC subunit UvrB [candidate division TA06 bacterium]
MNQFKLESTYKPTGDQPQAIQQLLEGINSGVKDQVLLGVTGSGKTFAMANVIAQLNRPTLIISHNKTLAAQLYGEFKGFFPRNAVEYFISYYDYYQPEAYIPSSDTYIEKDASKNDDIDRLRLKSTAALLERRDVIIVASVSCIYSLGSPDEWKEYVLLLEQGQPADWEQIMKQLVKIQYSRNDVSFERATFRVRGNFIEVHPGDENIGIRIELDDQKVVKLSQFDPLTGTVMESRDRVAIYPTKHFVVSQPRLETAFQGIEEELKWRVADLTNNGKLLEAQRIQQRTKYDLELIKELGYCSGIENYSRYLSGRQEGERPFCLLDFFPKDYLLIVDESHVTIPQIGGMYAGDRSRKETLVEFGFRLPSALDNRPLRFPEFESLINQVIYTSATPADYELNRSKGRVIEQIIRPTGLVDPEVEVKPIAGQIDDLLEQIRQRVERKERVLVTTLTKKMSEDLSEYLEQAGVRVRYMHSEINAIERVEILRGLRLGEFDVLVGINLLREGLDLPEVSLVAILDADKEGFLRSERSLIQVSGRAARHVQGQVIMYADRITDSMKKALDEMNRRRTVQLAYNQKHCITPLSIIKSIEEVMMATSVADSKQQAVKEELAAYQVSGLSNEEIMAQLEKAMFEAAAAMDFERAAVIRDQIKELKGDEAPGKPKRTGGIKAKPDFGVKNIKNNKKGRSKKQ